MKHVPPKLQPWFDARRRFKLTNAEVQMARELGMNPKKFGGLANERQEPWKMPLREFIASCYRKSFGRSEPPHVLSLEEVGAKEQARRAEKQKKRQAAAGEHAWARTWTRPQPLHVKYNFTPQFVTEYDMANECAGREPQLLGGLVFKTRVFLQRSHRQRISRRPSSVCS